MAVILDWGYFRQPMIEFANVTIVMPGLWAFGDDWLEASVRCRAGWFGGTGAFWLIP